MWPLRSLQRSMRQRDAAIEDYEAKAEGRFNVLKLARERKDFPAAVRLATFGARDFALSKR